MYELLKSAKFRSTGYIARIHFVLNLSSMLSMLNDVKQMFNIGTFPLLKYYLNNVYRCLPDRVIDHATSASVDVITKRPPDVWKVFGETNTKYIYATNIAI